MLKIYRKTIKHEIHSNGVEYKVDYHSCYVIIEEAEAQSHTREYSLYDDKLQNTLYFLGGYVGKRGRVVHVYSDDGFYRFKQWKEPDAKLIEYVTYVEYACSMNQLCRLPADKVIAYLKQEGLNFTLTN